MHPQKERCARLFRQPVKGRVGDDVPGPLHLIEVRLIETAEFEAVVVEVEAVIEPEARIQHCRTDHRPGVITMLLQNRGQRGLVRTELVSSKIMHAAAHWVGPSEYRGVRRKGYGHRRVGTFKARARGGECI